MMWAWLKDKAWPFIKRWGKVIAALAVALAGFYAVARIAGIIRRVRVGKVTRPSSFQVIPGIKDQIAVKLAGEWYVVDLPEGVKAKRVTAIEITPKKEAIVEVKHEATDRRGIARSGGGGA